MYICEYISRSSCFNADKVVIVFLFLNPIFYDTYFFTLMPGWLVDAWLAGGCDSVSHPPAACSTSVVVKALHGAMKTDFLVKV